MKLVWEQVAEGEEEVVIKYHQKNSEMEEIARFVTRQDNALMVNRDGQQLVLRPRDIIYCESVDGITYLYTQDAFYKTGLSLLALEAAYYDNGFFRSSKSMVININRISKLKSDPNNRIDAAMDNGEHVIISRRYAKELRRILKDGKK